MLLYSSKRYVFEESFNQLANNITASQELWPIMDGPRKGAKSSTEHSNVRYKGSKISQIKEYAATIFFLANTVKRRSTNN